MIRKGVTESFGAAISGLNATNMTDTVVHRSKRMILDTLGVGLLGTSTPVFHTALRYSQRYTSLEKSCVWGRPGVTLPPQYAALVNGVAIHSMDFDDTWHPATHPSGTVLPALLALSESMPVRPSGLELLLAFSVGIEVQGRLLRFSKEADNIPKRFHPPAVVGVMGSAAATAKLLGLDASQSISSLAVAASSAGAPMANAATSAKPLHVGNASRRGLEATLLAQLGLEGNQQILETLSGFAAFFSDYAPTLLPSPYKWVLEEQDVAIKSFPAHLAMHWVAEAVLAVRMKLLAANPCWDPACVRRVVLRVPESSYIDRPYPNSEHEARHSFQFTCSTALLDGGMSPDSFTLQRMQRPELLGLLKKVQIETPEDNLANFVQMYCEVLVEMEDGQSCSARCNTFYGHWRKPLSRQDLVGKFMSNALTTLPLEAVEGIVSVIDNLEKIPDCSILSSYLQMSKHEPHCARVSHRLSQV